MFAPVQNNKRLTLLGVAILYEIARAILTSTTGITLTGITDLLEALAGITD